MIRYIFKVLGMSIASGFGVATIFCVFMALERQPVWFMEIVFMYGALAFAILVSGIVLKLTLLPLWAIKNACSRINSVSKLRIGTNGSAKGA